MSWTASTPGKGDESGKQPGKLLDRGKQAEWRAEFFLAKGWQSEAPDQQRKKQAIKAGVAAIEQRAAQPGRADALRTGHPKAPGSFLLFLDKLAALEKTQPPRPMTLVAEVRDAAARHLAFHDKLKPAGQAEPAAQLRKQTCETTLADLRGYNLRSASDMLPDPPWGSRDAMAAASLQAACDFESLPVGRQVAQKLDGNNANPAYWVQQGGAGGAEQRTFLFKPTALEDPLGFPPEEAAFREALASRSATLVGAMIGLSFGVPDTQVVKVGRDRFDPAMMGAIQPGGPGDPVVGSLQRFAKGGKEMRGFATGARKNIKTETCQKLAILDILTLNCDRHHGNLLQTGTEQDPDLIPIDHGGTFPGKGQLATTSRIGSSGSNVLLTLPGTHEPFSPDMLRRIDALDPAALAAGLQSETDTMSQVHGGAERKIGADAVEIARRSAVFLKLAAPWLTPGSIQVVISLHGPRLFDPDVDERAFQALARTLINGAVPHQSARGELAMMMAGESNAMVNECRNAGWRDISRIEKASPTNALAIFKSGVRRAVLDDQPDEAADGNSGERLRALKAEFPDAGINETQPDAVRKGLKAWRYYVRAGGRQALEAAITELELTSEQAGMARQSPDNAAQVILDVGTIRQARQIAAADPRPWRKRIDYLRTLMPEVPEALRPFLLRQLTALMKTVNSGASARAIEKAVTDQVHEVVDLVRLAIVTELEALRQPYAALIARLSANANNVRKEELRGQGKRLEGTILAVQISNFEFWTRMRDEVAGHIAASAIP